MPQKQNESLGNGRTLKSVAKHEELDLESSSAVLISQQLMQLISTGDLSFHECLNVSQCAPQQYAKHMLASLSSFLNICYFTYFIDRSVQER